ncbi:peptidoglycan DD-metalloendopeptidase family protein [Tropicimonas sp. S265A]|uniref:peptidoglycan DD-metalloendopeptidase family protein n=1 Tax=Tropicimonas sp. S265A TaxID=3415134 RepID=UPI003C7DFB29
MTATSAGLQLLLPLVLVCMVVFPPMSRLTRAVWVVALGMLFWFAALAVAWTMPPLWALWVYVAFLGLGTCAAFRRPAPTLPTRRLGVLALAGGGLACAGSAAVLIATLVDDPRPPEGAALVDLAAPLEPGAYLAVHAGASATRNAHAAFVLTSENAARFSGQKYAVDFLALGPLWQTGPLRAPGATSDYTIWNRAVLAPCSGQVLTARDDLPDMAPPTRDRTDLAGNHVILECGGNHVVLAHLRRGSVDVKPGDAVETGAPLGRVGNSGNTTQPHLHLHVQTPGTRDAPLSGSSIPFTVDGQWLVRNDRIRFD